MRLRLRSLRVRAPLVIALAVVATPVFAWLSHFSDATVGRRMLLRVERTAEQAVARVDEPLALDGLARGRGLWIRVVRPDGQALVDVDHDPPEGLAALSASLFFGPDGAPRLADWDAGQAPLATRPLAVQAGIEGQAAACDTAAGGSLLVCSAALALPDGRLVYVSESSRRAIRGLYDLRYQLVKLTLQVLIVGLLLGLWLGGRMVRPVELLRGQVLDRSRALSTRPVVLDRDDEFGDLAQAFNQLLAALEGRRQANEAFAADLVHELKNPVAAVKGAAEALARGPADAERQRRLALLLGEAGGRMDALVSQFLELARAEAGLQGQERVPMDLVPLVQALVDAAALRHEGVEFQLRLPPAAPVLGVADRLEACVRNLLDNAATFAREGEGPPRVQVELAPEHRGSEARGPGHTLQVVDSGPGIAEADRERVFERYFTRRHGGTGLGLPLARAVAQAHGGTLRAEAQQGGARLVLWLPAA